MKRIYNLFTCSVLAVAVAFTSCKPLDKTFDGLGPKPVATPPAAPTTDAITLADADFTLLPSSNPAQTNHFFESASDALNSIPTILNVKYPTAAAKSQITVTFPLGPNVPTIKLADSTYTHIAYTLTNADYLLVPKNTFTDFSDAQMESWFQYAGNPTKAVGTSFGSPVEATLAVVTFNYYTGGVSTPTTLSYIYTGGSWKKAYLITPAQYASVGEGGKYNDFTAADAPKLPGYFNTFLKSDALASGNAQVGDVQYVSFKYNSFQRVMPMTFDGTNWVASQKVVSAVFTKANSVWTGTTDNSVHYTLSTTDFTTIGNISGIASAAAITDIKAHVDFSIAAGSGNPTGDGSRWTDQQIANGIIAILKPLYGASASNNQKFYVTFKTYGGYSTEVEEFNYDGTNFVYLPVPSNNSYTLTGDDYTALSSTINSGATDAAKQNLNQYGDFSSAWTADNIKAGIAAILTTRYPAATSGQVVAVTYAVYSGSNVITTAAYKYSGSAWVAQ